MSEGIIIAGFVCLAFSVVGLAVILGVLIYNQMLLLNEVNKRLLLITTESIEKERITQDELNAALEELNDKVNSNQKEMTLSPDITEDEEPFNPHTYHDSDLD